MKGLFDQKEERLLTEDIIKKYFIFSLMWSFGALLELDDRLKLQARNKRNPIFCDGLILFHCIIYSYIVLFCKLLPISGLYDFT